MSFDPIKIAMAVTTAKINNVALPMSSTSANELVNATTGSFNAQSDATKEKLDALAKYKDPELIKKEIEAKVMVLIADKQEEILAQKDDIEKQVAEKIALLTTLYLNFPPKLPVIDVKALAKKKYQETKKQIRELRQKVSKENLKNAKEKFKYPMKPTEVKIPTLPQIPQIPTIPRIPQL